MQNTHFSFIATALGLILLALLMKTAPETIDGPPKLPLLTMLIVSEFGFFVTAIGAFTAIKTQLAKGHNKYLLTSTICCILLSIKFLLTGISYWPL